MAPGEGHRKRAGRPCLVRGGAGQAPVGFLDRAKEEGGHRLPAPGGGALPDHDRRQTDSGGRDDGVDGASKDARGRLMHRTLLFAATLLVSILWAGFALAHGMRTAYLELYASDGGRVVAVLKTT